MYVRCLLSDFSLTAAFAAVVCAMVVAIHLVIWLRARPQALQSTSQQQSSALFQAGKAFFCLITVAATASIFPISYTR